MNGKTVQGKEKVHDLRECVLSQVRRLSVLRRLQEQEKGRSDCQEKAYKEKS